MLGEDDARLIGPAPQVRIASGSWTLCQGNKTRYGSLSCTSASPRYLSDVSDNMSPNATTASQIKGIFQSDDSQHTAGSQTQAAVQVHRVAQEVESSAISRIR
jgi:hypothetical protein